MSDVQKKPRREKAFLVMRMRRVGLLPVFAGAHIAAEPAGDLTARATADGEFFVTVLSHEAERFDAAANELLDLIMRRSELEWARPWVDPSPQQVIGSRLPLHDALNGLAKGTDTVHEAAGVIAVFELNRVARREAWLARLAVEREGK